VCYCWSFFSTFVVKRTSYNFASGVQCIVVSMSYCISLQLSQKPLIHTLWNFWYLPSVAVAGSCSHENAVPHIFLVLWIASCFFAWRPDIGNTKRAYAQKVVHHGAAFAQNLMSVIACWDCCLCSPWQSAPINFLRHHHIIFFDDYYTILYLLWL